ncbi:MAG: nuclear transport factor 2 family protein [Acidimicrobiia bacterium]
MNHASAREWLDRYVRAWESYDPNAIGDLFAEGIEYRYHPADAPLVGRTAVVESWLGDPDDAGTFEAVYEPYAVDGNRVVATGWSRYYTDPDRTETRAVYDNCFAMEFDAEGRCVEFTEWFRERA